MKKAWPLWVLVLKQVFEELKLNLSESFQVILFSTTGSEHQQTSATADRAEKSGNLWPCDFWPNAVSGYLHVYRSYVILLVMYQDVSRRNTHSGYFQGEESELRNIRESILTKML